MTTSKPPVVPYIRRLDHSDGGEVGPDVVAVKRALSRAQGVPAWGDFTRVWGPYAAKACAQFQRRKGLKPTGTYTFATHEALRKTHRQRSRTEWAFDAYSIQLLTGELETPLERAQRRTVDAVDYAILHRDRIAYSQARPADIRPYPHLPRVLDCSSFMTWAARSGGWPEDPNGYTGDLAWSGYGFTGTLWEHGQTVGHIRDARVCDMVFYGRPWQAGGAAHVGIVRQIIDGTVYIGHHGQTAGPFNSRADYRQVVGIRRYRLVA